MKRLDKKAESLRRLQMELDIRTQAEEEAVRLISNGEYEKACELLNTLDDSVVKEIERELDSLDDADEEKKEEQEDGVDYMTEGFVIEISHRSEKELSQICRIYIEKGHSQDKKEIE